MPELKPCPFCGGKAKCKEIQFVDENEAHAFIECAGCRQYVATVWWAKGIVKFAPEDIWDSAIEAWNRRVNDA